MIATSSPVIAMPIIKSILMVLATAPRAVAARRLCHRAAQQAPLGIEIRVQRKIDRTVHANPRSRCMLPITP
jgi:hypothetical protein